MQPYLTLAIFALAGYLLGAIPVGVLIAKSKGVDIFKYGSGNPGATNVKRACGRFAGDLCFVLDALKGFLATYLPVIAAKYFGVAFNNDALNIENVQIVEMVALICAIMGHMYSVFTHFKGGKGVSITIGGLAAFMPYVILIGLVIWVVSYYSTKYVSVASMLMAISLPIGAYFFYYPDRSFKFYVAIFLAAIVVYKHKSNISRLINGTENRFK